jgi:hypothetical protein
VGPMYGGSSMVEVCADDDTEERLQLVTIISEPNFCAISDLWDDLDIVMKVPVVKVEF